MAHVEDLETNQPLNSKKINPDDLHDPLQVQDTKMEPDIYSLTWACLQKHTWQHMSFRGVHIFMTSWDIFNLMVQFLFFLMLIIFTLTVLLYDIYIEDVYINASWTIISLRICMVIFSQKKLAPECNQALTIIYYSHMRHEEFTHPTFAVFVGVCQLLVAMTAYIVIMVGVCLQDESMDLVIQFAELAVVTELDNWMGEWIMNDKPHDNKFDDNHLFNLENLNERMGLHDKMSMIDEEELVIKDDRNYHVLPNCFLIGLGWIIHHFPWSLMPLLTLLFEHLMEVHNRTKNCL